MAQGDIVLVPFPFTGLSGQKRRPALVVSPDGFDPQGIVLCAITSRAPGRLHRWDVSLQAQDLIEKSLPMPSVIKASKLFTMHQRLIVGRFGTVSEQKLADVLRVLQQLFRV